MANKTIALILARGGSKGIPNKNIIRVNGRPLIYYTITAALKSNCDEVWVSSDSNKILNTANLLGAEIIRRPREISQDDSKSEEALLHFTESQRFNKLVFIQPTSPLIKPEHINKGLEMMNEYDSVFSAYKEHWIPRWTNSNKPHQWEIEDRPMRQDKEELWVENGAFYITTREELLKSKLRYSGNIGIVEMKQSESFQIDTLDDLEIMRKLL